MALHGGLAAQVDPALAVDLDDTTMTSSPTETTSSTVGT